uniref:Uncharacterized protein n=1 Tax=Tanacetum cinerariifolium TaxID=118510 RepID=A0A6L2J6H6_TANCI|nr:hypothetical protein [Tanacetum cinerariifolium]
MLIDKQVVLYKPIWMSKTPITSTSCRKTTWHTEFRPLVVNKQVTGDLTYKRYQMSVFLNINSISLPTTGFPQKQMSKMQWADENFESSRGCCSGQRDV